PQRLGAQPLPSLRIRPINPVPASRLTEGLHRLLNCRCCPLEILRYHCWRRFDAGVQCQKPRLRNAWELRSVIHVEYQNAGAPAAFGNEISSLGLLLLEDGLDHLEAVFFLQPRCPPRPE